MQDSSQNCYISALLYMKFERNPIENDFVTVTTAAERQTTDKRTDKPKTEELRQHLLAPYNYNFTLKYFFWP